MLRTSFVATLRVALAAALLPLPSAATAAAPPPLSVDRILSKQKPPGAQVLMIDHGRVIEDRNIGVSDLTTKRPVDAHTRFEVGSVSKQFTAAAIMQLAERGKLSLSDPLGKWVPQYVRGRRITLEQLLWQVSGIPNYTDTPAFRKVIGVRNGRVVYFKRLDLNAALALIAKEPLHFRPGSAWEYSNTNYALLGTIVAAASGMPWRQYVRTHLFGPAGMTDSTSYGEPAARGVLATGYLMNRKGEPLPAEPDRDEGDGGVVSTAHDLAKWNDALFGGKIVSAKSLARMTTPGPHDAGSGGYGFGLRIDTYDGVRRISHAGTDTGFTAANQVYPSLSQQVIVLTNTYWTDASDIADAAFDAQHPNLFASKNAGAAGEDRTVTALVKRVWSGMVSGHVDTSTLIPGMTGRFARSRTGGGAFAAYGTAARWIFLGKIIVVASGPRIYEYRLMFAGGKVVDLDITLTAGRRVAGLFYYIR